MSWAVTRGPSLDPADKRLAVRTEDHPISYANFEGIIPPRNYGAGTVMLWDTGTWEPLMPDPRQALEEGVLKFRLNGKRMQGRWALVRFKGESKRENWLLVKERDEFAAKSSGLGKYRKSITTGRTRREIERQIPEARPKGKRSAPLSNAKQRRKTR